MNNIKLFPDLTDAFYGAELIMIKLLIDQTLAGTLRVSNHETLREIQERAKRILRNDKGEKE